MPLIGLESEPSGFLFLKKTPSSVIDYEMLILLGILSSKGNSLVCMFRQRDVGSNACPVSLLWMRNLTSAVRLLARGLSRASCRET